MRAVTILVVDDDADIRFALAEGLQMEGYRVRLAANGVEAIESIAALRTERCVVLLDMLMPTMGGEEVLQLLRNEDQLPTLPVIVVSATTPLFAATAGARLCLNKPIALDVLLRVLERLCDEPGNANDVSHARLRATPATGALPVAECAGEPGADAEKSATPRDEVPGRRDTAR